MSNQKSTLFKKGDVVKYQAYNCSGQASGSPTYGLITNDGSYHPFHQRTYWMYDAFFHTHSGAIEELTLLTGDQARVIQEINTATELAHQQNTYSSLPSKWTWLQTDPSQWVKDWDTKSKNVPDFLKN